MADHTVKAFDNEIAQLRGLIAEMGGLAEIAIRDAIEALVRHDEELAQKVIAADRRLDALEADVDRLAVRIIALRAPMANDLRDVIAALKISGVVERIGDYAKNIAKRTLVLSKHPKIETPPEMAALAAHALASLREVMDSFTTRDSRKAEAVWRRDQEIDDLASRMQRGVIQRMATQLTEGGHDAAEVECSTHFLFIAKNLERVGDHATNIAEVIQFQLSGSWIRETRPKGGEPGTVLSGGR